MTTEQIKSYLLGGKPLSEKIYVTSIDDEVKQFNSYNVDKQLTLKTAFDVPMSDYWNIPNEYKTLDVEKHVYRKLLDECKNKFDDDKTNQRINRVEQELELYSKYNMLDLLKTLIYVVDTFKEQKVVWGTGRGSSCSSYILYLINLHDVDSVEYDLDIFEFFR